MTPDVIRELGEHQPALLVKAPRWSRAARAIHAKLLYPQLRSPHDVVIQITETGAHGSARGLVLSAPIWGVAPGASFEEVRLQIPGGKVHAHQNEHDFLSMEEGGIIRTQVVHSHRASHMPPRQVGDIVEFPINGVGVLPPRSLDNR